MNNRYLIIGGTEKSATTSLYEYFSKHPEIISSRKKETDYFREKNVSEKIYNQLYFDENSCNKLRLEASPSYLGLYEDVIPKVKSTLNNPKWVFMLRDPIDRLLSSFKFHKSKIYIDKDMDINTYVKFCFEYELGNISLEETPFDNQWFLNVLKAGKYKECLECYFENFNHICLIDFTDFKDNTRRNVMRVSEFSEISPDYFDKYQFFTANQTFLPANRVVHRFSMFVNNSSEFFFRRNPRLKRFIVKLYRSINEDVRNSVGDKITADTLKSLQNYYKEDYKYVKEIFKKYNNQDVYWRKFDEK